MTPMTPRACVELLSVTWDRALLAYSTGVPGHVEATITGGDDEQRWRSEEACGIGRLPLGELAADTLYTVDISWSNRHETVAFRTRSQPQGECLGSFAVVADPHVSLKPENRKGRFFTESPLILGDVVNQCRRLGVDGVVMPGDLTNAGRDEEYQEVARILHGLDIPSLILPGNHDIHDEESRARWNRYYGGRDSILRLPFSDILGIDTADGCLSAADARRIEIALSSGQRCFLASHYQLFENPKVCRGGGHAIRNARDYAELLGKIRNAATLVYAGHQNIPAVVEAGRSLQINVVQPTQYPCGFLLARVYANGVYHEFIPISSEVLRQWSREAGDGAAVFYGERQWESGYRRGADADDTNPFFAFTDAR